MMNLLLVFLAGAAPGFEVLVAVPLGILRGMSLPTAVLIGFAGNALTILLEILIFQKLKDWWDRRKQQEEKAPSKRTARAENIWKRFGIPGLAMLGPVLIGSHLAAFLALALGSSKSRTAAWMLISLIIWAIVFGILAVLGVDAFFWTRQKLA